MQDKHSPRQDYLDRLERHVLDEARRLRQTAPPAQWHLGARWKIVIAACALAVVSMGIGAASVAAAYQAQTNQQRDLLSSDYERRLDLARQRLAIASDQLRDIERQVALGLTSRASASDAQLKVTEAQAAIHMLELQLQEVQLTGRAPVDDLSAPLVSGHDFVSDRLKVAMTVQRMTLQAAQDHLREAERRVAVGVSGSIEADTARALVVEVQAALQAFDVKMGLRQRFLAGALTAAQTDLRAIEAEAEQRRAALAPKVRLAQMQVDRVATLVQKGLVSNVDLVEARLKLQEAMADLAKVDLDLALVRQQLANGKTGGQ
jgi:outer membrane protein TolC